MSTQLFGAPVPRTQDDRLVKGEGRYLDDLVLPKMLHVALLRSQHPSATLKRIDATHAKALPGVVDIVCHADLGAAGQAFPQLLPHHGLASATWSALAPGRVCFVGEAIAAVAAESIAAAVQAIEALTLAQVEALSGVPLHVVGRRTAAAARARGFASPASVAADGAELAQTLREAGMSSRNVLYLAGRHRKSAIEEACAKLDCQLSVVEIYEAQPAASLTDEVLEALNSGRIDAVLHFSRRSAEVFLGLADAAGLKDRLQAVHHVCISADAAQPLRSSCLPVAIAEAPDALSLFATLESL